MSVVSPGKDTDAETSRFRGALKQTYIHHEYGSTILNMDHSSYEDVCLSGSMAAVRRDGAKRHHMGGLEVRACHALWVQCAGATNHCGC